MGSTNKLTEGALFLGIFAVLLLITLYIPILGVAVNFFLALPFMMFAARNDRKSSFVFFVGAVLISFIVGTILAIPLAISYGLTGWIIGELIRMRKNRMACYIGGSIVFLITFVLEYAVSVAFFKIDVIKESIGMFRESIDQSFEMLKSIGQTPNDLLMEQFEAGIKMLETLTPSIFVLMSFIAVLIILLVSLPIMKRFGINVPDRDHFRNFNLPKSVLWYYLIALLVSLVITEDGSYWYLAIMNITFILQILMLLQGFSFIFYYAYESKWPNWIPVMAVVFAFLIPILIYIVRILGIIDLGFDLRKRMVKKK